MIPCEECLVLAMCRQKVIHESFLHLSDLKKCPLIKEFIKENGDLKSSNVIIKQIHRIFNIDVNDIILDYFEVFLTDTSLMYPTKMKIIKNRPTLKINVEFLLPTA